MLRPRQTSEPRSHITRSGVVCVRTAYLASPRGTVASSTQRVRDASRLRLLYGRLTFSVTDSVGAPGEEKRYKNFRVSRIAAIAGNEHIHHVFTGRESVNRAFSRDVVGGQRVSNSALTRRL